MALRLGPPAHLIDIGRLPELDAITIADNGDVSIGATVRHATVEQSDDVARYAPMVHQAMPYVGHRAIRTRGTLVGSITHADPAAELPAVVLATGATVGAVSASGSREINAETFFEGYLTTSLRSDELVTEVRFPKWSPSAAGAVVEVSRRHGDYAMAGLACRIDISDDVITDAALAFFGVAATPIRVPEAEAALVGQPPDRPAIEQAAEIVASSLSPVADIHASANYRRHVAGVLTQRGLCAAADQMGATV